MKLYLLLPAIFLIIGCTCVNDKQTSQKTINIAKQIYKPLITFNKDTNNYLKENFVLNKAYYIGKKFDILKNTIETPIIEYLPSMPEYSPKTPITNLGMSIIFYSSNIHDLSPSARIKGKYCTCLNFLYIIFDKPLNFSSVQGMFLKNKMKWTKEEDAYFDNMVIKDIIRSD